MHFYGLIETCTGRDAGTAIQDLQTLFIMGGEKWPSNQEITQILSSNRSEQELEMWLVDEASSKNAGFYFSVPMEYTNENKGHASKRLPRIWRRIDLVSQNKSTLVSWNKTKNQSDPTDDEVEIYGEDTGTDHFHVVSVVNDDDNNAEVKVGINGVECCDHDGFEIDCIAGVMCEADVEIVVQRKSNEMHDNRNKNLESKTTSNQDSAKKKTLNARRRPKKISRNKPCPCGSRKKYKACCHPGAKQKRQSQLAKIDRETIAASDHNFCNVDVDDDDDTTATFMII